jgi:hypothetical protein
MLFRLRQRVVRNPMVLGLIELSQQQAHAYAPILGNLQAEGARSDSHHPASHWLAAAATGYLCELASGINRATRVKSELQPI